MKYFICSDIHSHWDELKKSLEESGYDKNNPGHKLIILGDYFDKGSQAKEVRDFLLKTDAICLRGNHDDSLMRICETRYLKKHDFIDATYDTLIQLTEKKIEYSNSPMIISNFVNENQQLLDKLQKMPYYVVVNNVLFLHSWFPEVENLVKATRDEWHRATYTSLTKKVNDVSTRKIITTPPFKNVDTIVFGHHYAEDLDMMDKYEGEGVNSDMIRKLHTKYINLYAVDGCVDCTNKIPVLIMEM